MRSATADARRKRVVCLLIAASTTLVSLAGASAGHAAVVSALDGNATFLASPGEANDVLVEDWYFEDQDRYGVALYDAGAPLRAGAGCTPITGGVACDATHVAIHTADQADVVTLVDRAIVYVAAVYGGNGSDRIVAANPLGGEFHGERGADVIEASFNMGGFGSVLTGGPGDDTISVNEAGGVEVFGDQGDDSLWGGFANYEAANLLSGGRGDDRLETIDPPGWIMDGGPGDDDVILGGFPE